jgi:hypothetical protein
VAVDTRDKRASCLGFVAPPRLVLPNPDGTIAAAERCQLGYSYCGLTPSIAANYRGTVAAAARYIGTVAGAARYIGTVEPYD